MERVMVFLKSRAANDPIYGKLYHEGKDGIMLLLHGGSLRRYDNSEIEKVVRY